MYTPLTIISIKSRNMRGLSCILLGYSYYKGITDFSNILSSCHNVFQSLLYRGYGNMGFFSTE